MQRPLEPVISLHRAPAGLTIQQQIVIWPDLGGEILDLIQRRMDRSRNMTGGEFRRGANIDPPQFGT